MSSVKTTLLSLSVLFIMVAGCDAGNPFKELRTADGVLADGIAGNSARIDEVEGHVPQIQQNTLGVLTNAQSIGRNQTAITQINGAIRGLDSTILDLQRTPGPPGPAGPQGIQGIQGEPGIDGTAIDLALVRATRPFSFSPNAAGDVMFFEIRCPPGGKVAIGGGSFLETDNAVLVGAGTGTHGEGYYAEYLPTDGELVTVTMSALCAAVTILN